MPAASADLRQLAQDLRGAGQDIERVAAILVQQTAQKVQQLANANAPRDTGKLAASITITYVDRLTAVIGPTATYGVFQEFGTGTKGEFPGQPYEIRPKTKPYLVFKTKSGKTVVTRLVHHPGVKAQPFMRPAAVQALDPFAGELLAKGLLLITKGPRSVL